MPESFLPVIHDLIRDGKLEQAYQLAQRASTLYPEFKVYSDKQLLISTLIANSDPKKTSLRIALLSERYLNRFGVDRVFIMIARKLISMGHEVILVGQRFEADIIREFQTMHIELPPELQYLESDIYIATSIEMNSRVRDALANVDYAISSGWPFFQALRALERLGVETYYYDFGIVPLLGLPEGTQKTLSLLHSLKRLYLSHASRGCGAISRFIMKSQTAKCISSGVSLSGILLGSDHLNSLQGSASSIAQPSCQLIFLGRCELGNYKQTHLLPELIKAMRQKAHKHFNIGLLANAAELPESWPENYPELIPLGHVSDIMLQQQILECSATFVLSGWEGFNLPLAESIALGKPCFVFNAAAHPEVVAHPWLLCEDINEMTDKLAVILENGLPSFLLPWIGANYSSNRTWEQTTIKLLAELTNPSKVPYFSHSHKIKQAHTLLVIDVTNSSRDPANSGVVRVTRRASASIQELTKNGLQTIFVSFDSAISRFRLLTDEESKILSSYNGPKLSDCSPSNRYTCGCPLELAKGLDNLLVAASEIESKWFLLAEIHHGAHLDTAVSYFSRLHGLKMSAIFYDMIPIMHPEYVLDETFRSGHHEYLAKISAYDILFSISAHAAAQLSDYLISNSMAIPSIKAIGLGADCDSRLPLASNSASLISSSEIKESTSFILCVSTLEPRKNHTSLIESFNTLCSQGLNSDNVRLVLVGNRYHGADRLHEYVLKSQDANPLISYEGIISDSELEDLYKNCLFTVYPSLAEGYGLPIVESLFYNKPVVCHNEGSTAELASSGGCVAVNCQSIQALSDALKKLLSAKDNDSSFLKELCDAASKVKTKSWALYAEELVSSICVHHTLNRTV